MSYDVTFEIGTGGTETVEVAWRNYTSNASIMWRAAITATAGTSRTLGDLIEANPKASDLAPIVTAAHTWMVENPVGLAAYNPANGWGNHEGATEYMGWIAEMCRTHPACTVRVSR